MSIIHNSSLTFSPVAYTQKPQSGRIDNGEASTIDAANNNANKQRSDFNGQPSSTEQIKAALADAGLSNENANNQTNNTRTQKALNAYTQNHNQTAQLKVAEIISGIDLYA